MGAGGGGGKGGGSAVSAPDFQKIAQEQAKLSQQNVDAQTLANRANQTNAFGASSQWAKDPTTGQWTQQQSFGGPLGSALSGLAGQAAANATGNPEDARTQSINAAYGQMQSRLDPQWNQNEEKMRSRLAAQGLAPGSQAYDAAMGNFGRERNDAYASALNNSIMAGNAGTSSYIQAAQSPYQQLGMLAGLGQQSAVPMAGQAQTPDMLGAAQQQYQAALNSNAQKQGGKNSTLSGLGSLAGTVAGSAFGGPLGGAIGGSLGGSLGGGLGSML